MLVETLHAVPAEVVVLVEVRDLLAGEVLRDVVAEDLALDHVVRLPAERVRVRLGLVPAAASGRDEQVRHALAVQEVDDLGVGRRAERTHHREHLVLQDELLGQRDGLRRVVRVVEVLERDLAPVDAAVGVDVVEERLGRRGDLAVAGRGRTGQRLRRADRHRRVGNPRDVLGPTPAATARGECERDGRSDSGRRSQAGIRNHPCASY